MKKHVLMLALAISFCTTVLMAQGISGGFKAGLNFANQTFSSDVASLSPDGRTSWHAGFFATIKMGTLGLQPEVLYNSVGAEFDGSVRKIDYVSIPVMVRINFAKIVNIHAGPQFGLLLSAKDEDIDIKDELKSTDLGIGVGIGLDIPMGLTASLRYTFGISDINDLSGDGSLKNNVMQVSLGYKLFGK
jgi:hypothetical protein